MIKVVRVRGVMRPLYSLNCSTCFLYQINSFLLSRHLSIQIINGAAFAYCPNILLPSLVSTLAFSANTSSGGTCLTIGTKLHIRIIVESLNASLHNGNRDGRTIDQNCFSGLNARN